MNDASMPGFPARLTVGDAYKLVPAADLDGCLLVGDDGQPAGYVSRRPGLCASDAGYWTADLVRRRLGFGWQATLSDGDGVIAWSQPRALGQHRHLLIVGDDCRAHLRTRYRDRWEITLESRLIARLTVDRSIGQRAPFNAGDEAQPLGLVEVEDAPLAPRQRELIIFLALVVIRADDQSSPNPSRLHGPVLPPSAP